ncbi:protein FAM161A [Patella vulgata]|uniref:protein FAM161A n=1 Tax=Patella vulgata TaxID=6465 RepID=UPI00218069C3|nr:protein FAM161A [Patella vulgata]
MATMATGHALSVLANNSIKNPIETRTGKNASLSRQEYYRQQDHGDIFSKHESGIKMTVNSNGDTEYTSVPVFPPKDLKQLTSQNLSDDEFYERLSKMKEHQREALEKCEKLYMEKKALEEKYAGRYDIGDNNYTAFINEDIDIDTGTRLVNGALIRPDRKYDINDYSPTKTYDNICDMSSKPPIAPSPARPPSRQGKRPSPPAYPVSKEIKNKTYSFGDRPRSAPYPFSVVRSRSLDGDNDRRYSDVETDDEVLDNEEIRYITDRQLEEENQIDPDRLIRSQEVITPSKLELQRIESMWDNFAINDYMPRQRPSSAPSTRRQDSQKKASEWRHKLTIPEPFSMTLRDESKEKKQSSTEIQVMQERLQKEQEEELECQKKFKARPVPAHVYLPLYDEINEKNEAKRRYMREYSKELLKSQEKPFNFVKREQQKLSQRRNSEPNTRSRSTSFKKFKAKPVPSFVYEDTVPRKLKEEEEYRRLRMCMRSEELLREASLPPSMAAREKSKQQKIQEMKRQAKARKQFKPKIHRHIPDYDGMYQRFQREMNRKKFIREPTVVEPFRLETNRIQPSTDKILRDIARDEEVLTENRWPYRTPRARTTTPRGMYKTFSASMDSIPAKMTRAADTRNSTIRQSLERWNEEEKRQIEADRRRRIRENKLRQSIKEKTGNIDKNHTNKNIKARLRSFKEDERLREEQYQAEMEAMKEKVQQQPMLFERQRQTSAKNKVNKKFTNTLRSVGLDEDFVNSRSSAPSSIHGNRDYDDDYEEDEDVDATYVKTSDRHSDHYSDRHSDRHSDYEED